MLAANFFAGMQLYLAQASGYAGAQPVQFLSAEYGTSPAGALDRIRALLEQREIDLLIGSLSAGVAASLDGVLSEHRTPLIVGGVGANIARAGDASTYILRHKLSYWQSSWALGAWAARNQGQTAAVATSFYESGYDAHYAFRLGFESAGGTVIHTAITHTPLSSPDGGVKSTLAAIQDARPDVVCGFYCGREATEFVRAYADADLSRQIPLLGSAFLADEQLLPGQDAAALGIKTVSPWSPSLGTAENHRFVADYQASTGRPADQFALLGYDTLHMLDAVGLLAGRSILEANQLQQTFANTSFASPRGLLTFNSSNHSVETPLYLREVRRGASGLYHAVLASVSAPPAGDAALAALRADIKTGWSNTYLSV
jgi:branched-chain amino acid transport system substrate-binding protein